MRILILEDSNERMGQFRRGLIGAQVKWCNTARKAMVAMEAHFYDVVFLDHDLNVHDGAASEDPVTTGTGQQLALFVSLLPEGRKKDRIRQNTLFIVHSLNPAGSRAMMSILSQAGFQAVQDPFAWQRQVDLEKLVTERVWNSANRQPT